MDQHYSMALGRPLAMSSIGDCPAPEPITPDPFGQSLSSYITKFTLLGRQILSADFLSNDQIDRFSDELLLLKQTLPSLVNFDETWLDKERSVPGWPLDVQAGTLHAKTHNFLIIINRQRLENHHGSITESAAHSSSLSVASDLNYVPRGRERVLESCRALLAAFQFFQTRARAAMICWAMGQMAFNAAMLLTLSMLETNETRDLGAVQHTYSTFIEMNKLGIHKLAGDAVERLGPLLKGLVSGDSIKEKVMGQQGMMLLEDLYLQDLSPHGFSPLDFHMAGSDLRYDEKRRGSGRSRMGFPMSSSAKSALAQRRRAHRSLSLRDVRPRVPARRLSIKNPRSPTNRPPSGRLSPKKPKQEPQVMDSTEDIHILPTEPASSFNYISPTQPHDDSQAMFLSNEHVYQPFQATDFDPPVTSPLQLGFDTIPHSQPNDLPQYSAHLQYPPQNTPTDPNAHPVSYPTHINPSGLLLDGSSFHQQHTSQQQQQQLINPSSLDPHPYLEHLHYQTPQFDMAHTPVSYPPSF